MLEEGYAAVDVAAGAARAGLKPQLVHYYFRTMDDLFLALFRRRAEQGLERQARALASSQPLWALWDLSRDPSGTALTMEFTWPTIARRSGRRSWLLPSGTEPSSSMLRRCWRDTGSTRAYPPMVVRC